MLQDVQYDAAEEHIAVRREHILARRTPNADVLRQELEIFEPRIERQRVVVGAIDDDAAERAAVTERANGVDNEVDEQRPLRIRRPLDEYDFVRDPAGRELARVEGERAQKARLKIASVFVVAARQDDRQKRGARRHFLWRRRAGR